MGQRSCVISYARVYFPIFAEKKIDIEASLKRPLRIFIHCISCLLPISFSFELHRMRIPMK